MAEVKHARALTNLPETVALELKHARALTKALHTFRHTAMRPGDIRLWGLKTYFYEASRHTAMRPKDVLLWGLQTYCYEALRLRGCGWALVAEALTPYMCIRPKCIQYIYICIYMYIYMYIMYTYMYTYMYVYIYTYIISNERSVLSHICI
jgi:hypothetical protein